jgi:hypothetical protein
MMTEGVVALVLAVVGTGWIFWEEFSNWIVKQVKK